MNVPSLCAELGHERRPESRLVYGSLVSCKKDRRRPKVINKVSHYDTTTNAYYSLPTTQ